MDAIFEGIYDSIKQKVGKCTLAKELQEKSKSLYMVEEVIKEIEESDKKGERIPSNKNEPFEYECILQ